MHARTNRTLDEDATVVSESILWRRTAGRKKAICRSKTVLRVRQRRVFPGRSVQILARSFDSSAGPLETNRRRRSVLGLCARTMFSRRLVQIFARPEHFTQGFRKQSVSKRGRARRTAADAIWRQWWRRGRRRTVRVWWSKARARKLQRSIRRHYSTRRLARRSSELARRVRQSTKKR